MNTFYLGNCLEEMQKLADDSVDVVIADLPYGVTRAKWDCEIDLDLLWNEYHRVGKKNCPFVLFGGQPFTSKLIASNIKEFKYCWYWEKEKGTGFLNSKHQPLRCIEEICVFYKKSGKYNPQMEPLEKPYTHKLPTNSSEDYGDIASFNEKIQYKTYTHSYPKNLLRYGRDKSNRGIHSTQKPVALLEYLIKTYSEEGDVILDNTMGSGTTGVACNTLNRKFIGMEINEDIYKQAVERINNEPSRNRPDATAEPPSAAQ